MLIIRFEIDVIQVAFSINRQNDFFKKKDNCKLSCVSSGIANAAQPEGGGDSSTGCVRDGTHPVSTKQPISPGASVHSILIPPPTNPLRPLKGGTFGRSRQSAFISPDAFAINPSKFLVRTTWLPLLGGWGVWQG
jgi:hypothetical protein